MNTRTETFDHPMNAATLKWARSGSMMETIGALATMALAIVGLAGVFSTTLAAIATIVLGAGILVQSGAFSAGAEGEALETLPMTSGGLGAEFLSGVTGIVLGILALLEVVPLTLLSVALLMFGAAFLLSSSSIQFNRTSGYRTNPFGGSGQIMIGLGALVLGILAVIGLSQLTLILAGLLGLGTSVLFSIWLTGAQSYSTMSR